MPASLAHKERMLSHLERDALVKALAINAAILTVVVKAHRISEATVINVAGHGSVSIAAALDLADAALGSARYIIGNSEIRERVLPNGT